MSQTVDIDAGISAAGDVAPDDQAALADEVRRDLDRLFAPPAAAEPPPEAVRVAFVERAAARERRRFLGLSLRDAVLAACAAAAGLAAGSALAPHWAARGPAPSRAAEAAALKPSQPAARPELLALSAVDPPASAPAPLPSAADARLRPPAPPPATVASVRPRAEAAVRRSSGAQAAVETETSERVPDAGDCAEMPTLADEMVCDLPRLAAAQADLNAAYDAALSSVERPRALRREQADWLEQREVAARRSEGALERFYRLRTEELWRRTDEARGGPAEADTAFADGVR
jgi:uncharacterized protein YecT (DUF1311 family)